MGILCENQTNKDTYYVTLWCNDQKELRHEWVYISGRQFDLSWRDVMKVNYL